MVRGPEGGVRCHVNAQINPGPNHHVYYYGGEFVSDTLPKDFVLTDESSVAASILSNEMAVWLAPLTNTLERDLYNWFYGNLQPRLEALKKFPVASWP
jgi:hypothetical protein